MNECRVVIVGGGISGLSAAYFLSRRASSENSNLKITVLEASDRLGGVLRTLRSKDLSMEAGADTFDGKDPAVLDLCYALGIQEELLPCASTLTRAFISRNNDLEPLDLSFSGPGSAVGGPGLNIVGRARQLFEGLIPSRNNVSDESIASFIRRRFGGEVLRRWAAPLVRGILMAEPEKLSLHEYFPHLEKMEREYGSIARAVLVRKKKAAHGAFYTVRGGMDRLVAALVKGLRSVALMPRSPVASIHRQAELWEVRLPDGRALTADLVCIALPAPEAARLLAESAAPLAGELAKIRYDRLLVVNMIFRREELPGNFPGSGFIVPAREKKWPFSSLKVIGQTEDGKGVRLRAFVSGVFQSEVYGQGDERVQKEVLRCLAGEWGIQIAPQMIAVERYPEALAQYETGHAQRVAGIEKLLENYPGLFLTGNGYYGFGITDCIRGAKNLADKSSFAV